MDRKTLKISVMCCWFASASAAWAGGHGSIKLKGGESPATLAGLAKITEAQAREAALAARAGTVKDVELESEDGYLVYSVDILAGAKKFEVQIDAGDGRVLDVEDDDHDDDHDGDR